MSHIVTSHPHVCPKCKKENIGAAVCILKYMVCPDCYYNKYEKELEPIIKKMVNDYFENKPLTEVINGRAKKRTTKRRIQSKKH